MTFATLESWFSRLVRDEDGASATEYAVMLALIVVVCIASITTMGQLLSASVFGSVNAMFGS